jgi:serine phosphatase RsbU (regulator of sigma subunit)
MKTLKFKTRITLIFFAAYSLLSLYLIGFFYQKTIVFQTDQLRTRLMQVSALAASSIKADDAARIFPDRSGMKTREYADLVNKLRKAKETIPDVEDLYVLIQSDVPGVMKFIANADPAQVVPCGEDYDVTPYPELIKAFKEPSADREITRDKWGYWLSGYAPIRYPDGRSFGILGADISAATIGLMQAGIKKTALYTFLLGIIVSIITGNLASWWLTKPMKRLMAGMSDICAGNLDHKIPVYADDEFGRLSKNFNEMADKLKKYIEDLTETTKEKERLNRELEIAAELQKAMLPHYNIDVEAVDLAGMSLPAKTVGGDYFDYINRDGNNIGFVIADATGKGLHSSIFMTNSKSIFKVMTTDETSPAKVIRRTNDEVVNNIDPSATMFVTMFYGIYDIKNRSFKYSNAGHNPPVFISSRTNDIKLLGPHGYPIGIYDKQEYGEDEIKMESGDVVVLYTDGVVEAINGRGEMFGMERLEKICLESTKLSSREIVNSIKDKVFEFAENEAQFDDLTLLVFRVK